MTKQERHRPDLLNLSRMRRIARGSGHQVSDIQELHQRFLMARKVMGQLGQATGLFGTVKQAKKARRMFEGMGMGAPEGLGAFAGAGLGGADEGPRLSPAEKAARKKKARDARKARKQQRKHK
jgi:signal recognition particle subunit SRP54